MFLSENRSVVLRISHGVATIPLFWIDVPSSSKRIRLGSQLSGLEPNDEVECAKIFGPLDLSVSEYFGRREILKIFVVGHHINWLG